MQGQPLPNTRVVSLFISAFSPPRLQFFLENIQAIALLHIFFISWQRFDPVLIFSVIRIIDV